MWKEREAEDKHLKLDGIQLGDWRAKLGTDLPGESVPTW